MALINCPECGKEISDKASTCINCGCPIGNQSSEIVVDKPGAVTVIESTGHKAHKSFFTSMILNAGATGIYSLLIFSLLYKESTTETIEHQSDAWITIAIESLTEIRSTSALRDFLLEYPLFMVIVLIIGFAFSLLTYFMKNSKQKIFAVGSVVFSIISLWLCVVMASINGCDVIILLPMGVLYFVSALLTIIGIKECSGK